MDRKSDLQSSSKSSLQSRTTVKLPQIKSSNELINKNQRRKSIMETTTNINSNQNSSATAIRFEKPLLPEMSGSNLDSQGHQPPGQDAGLVAGLSMDTIKDLEESFAVFDRSGNGKIDSGKLYRVMTSVIGDNPTEAEVQDLIIANDADGGGTIEFDEYLDSMKSRMNEQPKDKDLRIVYNMLDRNKSGGIVLEDLVGFMRVLGAQLSQDEVEQMFEAVDLNGQRVITYEEFLNVVLSDDKPEFEGKLEEMGLTKDSLRVVPRKRNYMVDLELD